jgi:hypothetical protein
MVASYWRDVCTADYGTKTCVYRTAITTTTTLLRLSALSNWLRLDALLISRLFKHVAYGILYIHTAESCAGAAAAQVGCWWEQEIHFGGLLIE